MTPKNKIWLSIDGCTPFLPEKVFGKTGLFFGKKEITAPTDPVKSFEVFTHIWQIHFIYKGLETMAFYRNGEFSKLDNSETPLLSVWNPVLGKPNDTN